jgi:hypothetical protein
MEQSSSQIRIKYMRNKRINLERQILYGAFILTALVTFTQCTPAANVSPNPSAAPPPTTATLSTPAPGATASPTVVVTNPTSSSVSPMPRTPPQNTNQAAQQLVQALQLAAQEMRAAQTADSLNQIQTHSQTALNILVGRYGRWYSQRAPDPSNKLGVLPGEIQPQGGADLGGAPTPTVGLALLTMGTNPKPSAELVTILGDVTMWRTQPRAGYDNIASAVTTADTPHMQLGPLEGSVPRAVAWQRLILTQTLNLDAARAFAAQSAAELDKALAAARKLTQ